MTHILDHQQVVVKHRLPLWTHITDRHVPSTEKCPLRGASHEDASATLDTGDPTQRPAGHEGMGKAGRAHHPPAVRNPCQIQRRPTEHSGKRVRTPAKSYFRR